MEINASDIYSFYQSSLGSIVKRTVRQRITSVLENAIPVAKFLCAKTFIRT